MRSRDAFFLYVFAFLVMYFITLSSIQKSSRLEDENRNLSLHLEKLLIEKDHLLERINLLSSEVESLHSDIDFLNEKVSKKDEHIYELEQTIDALETEKRFKESQIESLSSNLDIMVNKYLEMKSDISAYLNWMKSNYQQYSNISKISYAENKCSGNGTLNYPCLVFYLDLAGWFKYIPEDGDSLKNLSYSFESGGGDCEEFSLLGSILSKKVFSEGKSLVLFDEGYGSFDLVNYGGKKYYLINASKVSVSSSFEPQIACYSTIPEKNLGHCLVRLYGNGTEIYFEPQTGQVIHGLSLCKEGEVGCSKRKNLVFLLITFDDFMVNKNGHWESFKSMLSEINDLVE